MLYFLDSHRLKDVDIKYIKKLSKFVTVIPVVSKGDSIKSDEHEAIKTKIVEASTDR